MKTVSKIILPVGAASAAFALSPVVKPRTDAQSRSWYHSLKKKCRGRRFLRSDSSSWRTASRSIFSPRRRCRWCACRSMSKAAALKHRTTNWVCTACGVKRSSSGSEKLNRDELFAVPRRSRFGLHFPWRRGTFDVYAEFDVALF